MGVSYGVCLLIVCQLPICDVRSFAAGPGLAGSVWTLPTPGSSFVRCFGLIEQRRRGATEVFPDEIYYSTAQNAIKLGELERHALGAEPASIRTRCAFRRLLCNGSSVVRLELGLADRGVSPGALPLAPQQIISIALDALELPVQVSRFRGSAVQSPLWAAGKHVADLYRAATTAKDDGAAADGHRLVAPCEPVLLIEHTREELGALPQGTQTVDPQQVGGADLSFLRLEYRRRQVGLWFLRRDSIDSTVARRLRLVLLRLHAEQQILKQTLVMLLQGRFQHVRGSEPGKRFECYLSKATWILSLQEHAGVSPAAIQEVVTAYQLVANPAERQLLKDKLEQVQRQIRTKVETHIQTSDVPAPPPVVEKGDVVRVFVSYSHLDKKYLKPGSLLGFLSGLKKERFDFWWDERIATGEMWDDQIHDEIRRADLALVLVSQAFLNSPYCQEEEIANFLLERRQRGMTIYPVILSPCAWETQPWLAKTQFQPRDGTLEENYHRPEGKRKRFFLQIYEELMSLGDKIRTARRS
jgi:hypothetical protein